MTQRNLVFPLVAAGLGIIAAGAGHASPAILFGSVALLIGAVLLAIPRPTQAGQWQAEADECRRILDTLPEGILHYAADGELLHANQAARKLIGFHGPEPAPPVSTLRLLDRNTRAELTPDLWADLQRGRPASLPAGACLISADGMEYEIEGEAIPVAGTGNGMQGAVINFRDVTEARAALRRQAGTAELDGITGLPTEAVLVERLERKLLSKRAVDRELAYLHIVLDGIDQLRLDAGQSVASQLLQQTTQVMLSRIRDSDTLSRVGDHAFGLLLPACPREVSERILGTLKESIGAIRFDWQGKPYLLNAQIGIVHAPPFAGAYDECQAQAIEAARRPQP